jgi:hypothetical protein
MHYYIHQDVTGYRLLPAICLYRWLLAIGSVSTNGETADRGECAGSYTGSLYHS